VGAGARDAKTEQGERGHDREQRQRDLAPAQGQRQRQGGQAEQDRLPEAGAAVVCEAIHTSAQCRGGHKKP